MDLSSDSERTLLTQLSDNLKPIIWVIEVSGRCKRHEKKVDGTGFSVGKDGLVMTCAHILRNMDVTEIKIRKLNEENFQIAKIKDMRPKWDVAILEFDKAMDCSVGEFVQDGSIWEGQPLLHIGNPSHFSGSYLIGRACVSDVVPPRSSETCGKYDSTQKTHSYRVMGNMWNSDFFRKNQDVSYPFEKTLAPSVPIIQCNGINAAYGCSGGPVFNLDGKIVGMLVAGVDNFDIVIHVSALKMFFNDATNPSEPQPQPQDTSKKPRTC